MQKVIGPLELETHVPGTFIATIATFNTVDKDKDVTFPGAFPVGAHVVVSAYGHRSWKGALPVGKGVIGADDSTAWLDGRFFINTRAGADTYTTIKHLGPLQQWSYGYDLLEGITATDPRLRAYPGARRGLVRLAVHEVSPVLAGAGIGTHTEYIKRRELSRVRE